jgi:hypothetical protein
MRQRRGTRARAVQSDGFAMEGVTDMHVLVTEEQAKVLAKIKGFDGNLIITQDGSNITASYASNGYLHFQRIASDGTVISQTPKV